jgi:hypothetical protein
MPLTAYAELYKSVDADGHVTYSSAPIKGGKKLNLEPLPTMVPMARVPVRGNFPRVDEETQKNRDETRRKILLDELQTEQKLLQEAKQNLQQASEQNRGDFVVNGKSMHNEARAQEYNAAASKQTDEVNTHQKNIEALNAELAKLK